MHVSLIVKMVPNDLYCAAMVGLPWNDKGHVIHPSVTHTYHTDTMMTCHAIAVHLSIYIYKYLHAVVPFIEYMYKCMHYKDTCSSSS